MFKHAFTLPDSCSAAADERQCSTANDPHTGHAQLHDHDKYCLMASFCERTLLMHLCMGELFVSCARMCFRDVRTAHIHDTSTRLTTHSVNVMFDTLSVHFEVLFCSSHSALVQTALVAIRQAHTDDVVSQS